jgi:hypothetical protein
MSPQALDAYEDMLNRAQSMFMGRLMAPELGPMMKSFHGRMYMNLSQMRRIATLIGSPPAEAIARASRADSAAGRSPRVRRFASSSRACRTSSAFSARRAGRGADAAA